jgi:hypothetical protein
MQVVFALQSPTASDRTGVQAHRGAPGGTMTARVAAARKLLSLVY